MEIHLINYSKDLADSSEKQNMIREHREQKMKNEILEIFDKQLQTLLNFDKVEEESLIGTNYLKLITNLQFSIKDLKIVVFDEVKSLISNFNFLKIFKKKPIINLFQNAIKNIMKFTFKIDQMYCQKGVQDTQTEEIRKMINLENLSIGFDYLVQIVRNYPIQYSNSTSVQVCSKSPRHIKCSTLSCWKSSTLCSRCPTYQPRSPLLSSI